MSDLSSSEDALAEIVEAVMERLRRGERPTVERYASRHPELAGAIRELLPALIAVERDLSVEGDAALPVRPGDMPDRLGDYRILREIGRGGMGIVYEAVQQSLGRHVALKVLPWASIGPHSVDRFRREARAAAKLHHTNIVPVFDVGSESDTHFFAMQYIRGQGLDQVVSELRQMRSLPPSAGAKLSIASRLRDGRFESPEDSPDSPAPMPMAPSAESPARSSRTRPGESSRRPEAADRSPPSSLLGSDSLASSPRSYYDAVARIVLQVAEALAYAHHHGILHRDVKPANILLDTSGTAWVTDFGLAKSEEDLGPTRTGDVIGTLRYMAPERYDGVSDPRSDIYGLGATFYELLTLQPLFQDAPRPQLIEMIRRREPVPPRKVDPRVPRDLEVICLKCLSKELGRRYASAEELAHDLQRYLDGQTITARRVGTVERSYRWCRRNPGLAGMLAALAASLTLGLVGTSYEWQQASVQRDEARTAAKRATDEARRADSATSRATAARVDAQRLAARSALAQGRSLADQGAVAQGMLWMAAALREAPPGDQDLQRLIRLNLGGYQDALLVPTAFLTGLPRIDTAHLSKGGRILATGRLLDPNTREYEGRFWDCETGQSVGPAIAGASRLWPSPVGRSAAAHRGDGSIAYLRVEDGRVISSAPAGELGSLQGVVFSPDGKTAAEFGGLREAQGTPGLLRLRDVARGSIIGPPLSFATLVKNVDFRADGKAIAVSCAGAEVSLWELGAAPRAIFRYRTNGSSYTPPLAFEPSGKHLLFGTVEGGGAVRFVEASTGKLLERNISLGDQSALGFSFSPDRRLLLTSESREIVRFWDAATDRPVAIPPVQIPFRTSANFISSIETVLVTPVDWQPGQARLIRIPEALELATAAETMASAGGPLTAEPREGAFGSAAYDATGDRFVVSGLSAARVIDAESGLAVGEPIRNLYGHTGPVALSRDGRTVAAVSNDLGDRKPSTTDCLVQVCQPETGRRRFPPLHPLNSVIAIDISPDGRTIATGDFSDAVQFWDAANGSPVGPPIAQENIVSSVAFSPDGRKLAVGTHRTRRAGHAGITIWDIEKRRALGPPARHGDSSSPEFLIWSPDSAGLVSLGRESSELIRVDGNTGAITARASDFPGRPTLAIASPDGRSILTGTEEGLLEVRDATSLQRTGPAMSAFDPGKPRRSVVVLAVAPDGRTVASGYRDGTVRLWDLATHAPIGPPLRYTRPLLALVFRHGGHTLTSLSQDGEVRSRQIRGPLEGPVDFIQARLEAETGLHIGNNQDLVSLPAAEVADRLALVGRTGRGETEAPKAEGEDPRHERAARFAERQGLWRSALFHLDRMIGERPSDGTLRLRRALALAAEGRETEANAELANALTIGPVGPCLDLLTHRAIDARDTGRFAQAGWAFSRAIEARPDDWRLYLDRALLKEVLGELAARDLDIDRAASRGADAHALARQAEALAASGRNERMRALLDVAAGRVEPVWSPLATRMLSTHEAISGRLDRAADLLVNEGSPFALGSLQSSYRRALAAIARHDESAYRSLCRELISRSTPGSNPSAQNLAAWVCSLGPGATDTPERVVSMANAAVDAARPEERGMLLNTLGAALIRAGHYAEGIRRVEEGIRLRGDVVLPQDRAFLAMANEALGRHEAAARWLGPGTPTTGTGEDLVEALLLHKEAVAAVFDRAFPADPFAPASPPSPSPGPGRSR